MKQDSNQFIGTTQQQHYTVLKTYLETQQIQIRLYHTKFTPVQPKYTLCIVHGFGEHSGRFYHIADFYAQNGFQVLLIDLRGFGYSGAPRGTGSVEKLQNDVMRMLKQARQDLPLFIYAHSLGGLITLKLLLDRPQINVTGCIITSPLLGFPKDRQMPFIKVWIMKQLGDKMQDFVINSMVNPTALTKNNKYMHTIFEDRLMIPFLSVKMAKSIVQAIQDVNQRMDSFSVPVIVFHGKADQITNVQDSKRFIYNKASAYKQLHIFENGFHQLQHDKQKDELLDNSMKFINSLPNSYIKIFGKLVALPIKPKKVNNTNKYIILLILLALVYLWKAKNINIFKVILQLFKKQ